MFWRIQNRSLVVKSIANNTSIAITDNEFVDQEFGAVMVRHEDDFADYTYSGNRYYTTADTGEWFFVSSQLQSFDAWLSSSGETGAEALTEVPNDPERDIESYAEVVGAGTTLADFIALARTQSRLHWRTDLMAGTVNDYVRAGFGR